MRLAYGRLNMSRRELNQLAIQETIQKWQRTPQDTGSSEVQVAVLTQKILRLSSHMSRHHKENSAKRRLQMLVLQRNRKLKYMRRAHRERYTAVLTGLGIRPNKNFDPTIKPARAASAARRRKKKHGAGGRAKSAPYGSDKSAKGRTMLQQHAHRQRRLQRQREAAARMDKSRDGSVS